MIDLQAEPAVEVQKLSMRRALSRAVSLRPSRAVTWLLSINIVARGLWLLYMHPPQHVDFLWYYTHAVQMAAGLGYIEGGAPTAYWPAGYPFFLSLLFRVFEPSVILGMAANALLSAGIVLLVYALAKRLTGDGRMAFWSALAYTLLPSQIAWNSVLGSEELATFLIVLSILLYPLPDRSKRYVATALSGFVMGLGCDVRPIPLLFPFFIFFMEKWIWGRKGAAATRVATIQMVVYGVALLGGVCPLTIRNWIDFHHLILVS
ncbi:MAG: glycosyltransferase family 39 protein, partial [Firmicutes bacterium]|nr:glycosyltransferase family 39 protein [Bacillota bacterium]